MTRQQPMGIGEGVVLPDGTTVVVIGVRDEIDGRRRRQIVSVGNKFDDSV